MFFFQVYTPVLSGWGSVASDSENLSYAGWHLLQEASIFNFSEFATRADY